MPNNTYRTGHHVDIATHVRAAPWDAFNGQVTVNSINSNEFLYYTIDVGETSSNYFIRINYGHGSSSDKEYKIEKLNPSDLSVEEVLVDAPDATSTDALPETGASFILGNYDTTPTFTLTAGETWVIKFTPLDGGPTLNYFQLINNLATLSVDEAKIANTLRVFPNPSVGGVFKINVASKWEVYSVLGLKVLEGNGKTVDLTSFAKGAYILKTPYESKMLISK